VLPYESTYAWVPAEMLGRESVCGLSSVRWIRACRILLKSVALTFWSLCSVPGELLLDTGALVSLLDRSQHRHGEFADFFQTWQQEVATTEAVLTEATHLLSRVSGGSVACLDFVLSGGAVLVPSSAATLRRARELMVQYADCPMDFADSTLVVLAEDLNTNIVLTTDRRDFCVYRIGGRKRFEIPI
jgi:predicted nucleic acid-binding protein